MTGRPHGGESGCAGNILCFDLGGVYMGVYIRKFSLRCTLKIYLLSCMHITPQKRKKKRPNLN